MYAIADLETLDVGPLDTPHQVEASASARAYLAEYAQWGLVPPEWLRLFQRTVGALLTDTQKEEEVLAVDAAKRRARNRLPDQERRNLIHQEIAALQEELRQI